MIQPASAKRKAAGTRTRAAKKKAAKAKRAHHPAAKPKKVIRAKRPAKGRPAPAKPVPKVKPAPPVTPTVLPPPAPVVPVPAQAPRLFAADSIWNAALPASAPIDPRSPALMSAFSSEIDSEIKQGIGPWISEASYSTPIYTVSATQPYVRVTLDTGSWGAPLQSALDPGVPIPADAKPAAGTDGHLTIYQPATDTLWEFWKAVEKPDGWHANWGGAMRNVSTSPGYYSSSSWPGLTPAQGWNWGSTATSLPVVAGTIRIQELRQGHIDHALALNIPDACAGSFSFPAQRSDGTSSAPDCLPEGAHLRIDPNIDLSSISMPPITRVLAEAAQRYGMIVRDRTMHATSFFAEDPSPTGSNPYPGAKGLFGGLDPGQFLPQFPWAHLQLMPLSLCSRAPCAHTS